MDEWNEKPWGDEEDEEDEFCNRECYEFNDRLKVQFDDRCCQHCIKYLTLQCEYLEEFMEEIEGLSDIE